jgi:hypothetical protein
MSTPPYFLPIAITSEDTLNNLYNSLVASGVQSAIYRFLRDPSAQARYDDMASVIPGWLTSDATRNSIGVINGGSLNNLRINISLSDGLVVYDSASNNNSFANIGIPRPDFLTTGKYLINENHGTRVYFMAASLSRSGKAYNVKFSNSTSRRSFYLAVRQNTEIENYGIITISLNPS